MTVVCPICESHKIQNDLRRHTAGSIEYSLARCASCDLMFWSPPRFPETGFYEHQEFGVYVLAHTVGHRGLAAHQKGFAKRYRGMRGKLLDVGCSDGAFLEWAKERGFDVAGVDVDEKATALARRVTPSIWNMQIEEFGAYARENELRFDVITMFEVLEHQPEPRVFLNVVHKLLAPGGWIAGTVPNRNRLFKTGRTADEFYGDLPPHHFLWFSALALANTLTQTGFKDPFVEIRMFGYRVDECLHIVGRSVKRVFTARQGLEQLPLERIAEAGNDVPKSRLALLHGIRAAKDVVKTPAKLLEASVERLSRSGASLYFQARVADASTSREPGPKSQKAVKIGGA